MTNGWRAQWARTRLGLAGRMVAGTRVIRLAEVVAGRRRTRKRRTTMWTEMCTGRGNRVLQAGETNPEGESSRQATSGWSGDEEGRWQVIRQYEEKRIVVTESPIRPARHGTRAI